ncbi:SdiA-regulated domain-containing protein [Pseudomonas sp. OIL-1]|uniref:SdiA-regulated domain-containing protein n=1 Tax=Pseudomonas sp. OIL-1 TaxID=2706126 RepID=UPI0013A795CD|nr:SdiA-regulated domain-containing protein [Pseudomonas sp. OIL-1]QIB50005.1 SdiA-regulated domain-containing protein [Pseudomonas sp. OIL-1]
MILSRKALLTIVAIAVIAVTVFLIRHFHWDDRLYYLYSTRNHAEAWQDKSVWLDNYEAVIQARPVSGVSDNLSGLTFDSERQQLWAVINGPNELIGLSLEGEVLSRHPLHGFDDVEGVVHLGDGQLAVVEERRQTLVVMPVPESSGVLERKDFAQLRVELYPEDNNEYEGLAYDPANDRLYIAKERDPMRLYQINDFTNDLSQRLPHDLQNVTRPLGRNLFLNDFSGLAFAEATDHLLVLSDESKLLIELGTTGQVISYMSLSGGFSALESGIPQAEGVTLDDQGKLYIVSEPNLFYRFEKPAATPPQP